MASIESAFLLRACRQEARWPPLCWQPILRCSPEGRSLRAFHMAARTRFPKRLIACAVMVVRPSRSFKGYCAARPSTTIHGRGSRSGKDLPTLPLLPPTPRRSSDNGAVSTSSPKRRHVSEVIDGHSRKVWCDADGSEVLEVYSIAGMGHGTPLKTNGDDGLGSQAPFMLDVGISSTWHIANFWGITTSGRRPTARSRQEKRDGSLSSQRSRDTARTETVRQLPHQDKAAVPSTSPSNGVRKVIEDALRTAGLIR